MRFYFSIIIYCFVTTSYGQTEDCYTLFRNQGIQLFQAEQFVEARDRFEAAEACRNKPLSNDLAEWRIKATAANEAALIKARDEAEKAKIEAQENERKAIRLARLTEGNRLALLANIHTDEKKFEEALFLSFEAYKLLGKEASPQIRQAFSQSVFNQMTREFRISEEAAIAYFQQLPNQETIWFSLDNNTIKSLNVKSLVVKDFTRQNQAIQFANHSADGQNLLIGSTDGTAYLKRMDGSADYRLEGHKEAVLTGMVSPQAQKVITCSRDNMAKIWDINGKLLTSLSGHTGNIYEGKFSDNGKNMLTRSADGTVKIWNSDGQLVGDINDNNVYVYSAQFSPDGSKVLTASANHTAQLWDLKGKLLAQLDLHTAAVKEAIFSKRGDKILTRSLDNTVKLWDLNGQLLADLKGEHTKPVTCAVFGPDEASILTGSKDKSIIIWNTQGESKHRISTQDGAIIALSLSPDGQYFLSTSQSGTGKLWDLKGQQLMAIDLKGASPLHSCFSLDGKSIINIIQKEIIAITPLPDIAFDQISQKSPIPQDKADALIKRYDIQNFENK